MLATDEGYITVILPNQTLGVGGELFLDDDYVVSRLVAQVKAGDFEPSDPIPLFTSENVAYQAGSFFSSVTGLIVSPYSKEISNIRVSAVAYDEAGEIIGGGFTFVGFVPANGKAAADVSITSSGVPATVELYATVTSLSDFE